MTDKNRDQGVALTALVIGYNEMARNTETLGSRLWFRLMASEANKAALSLGCGVKFGAENPQIGTVVIAGQDVPLRESDYELMREALRIHDERKEGV